MLDGAINIKLLPSFKYTKVCGKDEGLLLLLTTELGRMGITAFSEIAEIEFQNSSLLTKEHISTMAQPERTYWIQKETINNIKKKIRREKQEYIQQKLVHIRSRLTGQQFRLNNINTEQDAST